MTLNDLKTEGARNEVSNTEVEVDRSTLTSGLKLDFKRNFLKSVNLPFIPI